MKVKYLWASLIALTSFSCSDSTDSIGLNMMPDTDDIKVEATTYPVTTETVLAGPVFAKTSMGYLGNYTDPQFGQIKADFLTQLTCTEQFSFPLDRMVAVNDKAEIKDYNAESASINLYYTSFFGNPSSANRLSIYQLDKELTKDNFTSYYTNVNPADYYSSSSLHLQKAYSAVDMSVVESVRNASNYYPSVSVKFPLDKANEIIKLYQTCKANKTSFKDAFSKAFKGLYIKCDYGDGTILYIDQVNLNISFKVYAMEKDGVTRMKKKQKGQEQVDSTYVTAAQFGATKEVVQANSFTNDQTLTELAKNNEYTMIKSPAGLFTKVNLPIEKLISEMNNVKNSETRVLNTVRIAFDGYNSTSIDQFGMNTPSTLLLIRQKDMKDFFEKNMLPNNKTSFLSGKEAGRPNRYVFTNISTLFAEVSPEYLKLKDELKSANAIDAVIINAKIKALFEFVLVPVVVNTDKSKENNLVSVRHDLRPSYIKLKGGKTPLNMEVVYSTVKK